jgi:hypothetical protein
VIRVYDEAGNVIDTHEHAGDFKEWQRDQNVCDHRVSRPSESECGDTAIFSLLSPRTLLRNNWGGRLSMKTQIPNINVVRSAWRRVKKDIKDAIIRDLRPVKDVKGGGGVTGESKPTTGDTGTTGTTGSH